MLVRRFGARRVAWWLALRLDEPWSDAALFWQSMGGIGASLAVYRVALDLLGVTPWVAQVGVLNVLVWLGVRYGTRLPLPPRGVFLARVDGTTLGPLPVRYDEYTNGTHHWVAQAPVGDDIRRYTFKVAIMPPQTTLRFALTRPAVMDDL